MPEGRTEDDDESGSGGGGSRRKWFSIAWKPDHIIIQCWFNIDVPLLWQMTCVDVHLKLWYFIFLYILQKIIFSGCRRRRCRSRRRCRRRCRPILFKFTSNLTNELCPCSFEVVIFYLFVHTIENYVLRLPPPPPPLPPYFVQFYN